MESRKGGAAAAAEDAGRAMPSFGAPQPTIHTDVNSMQPSRVTDFWALAQSAGFRIEDLASLSMNTLFNLKPNTHIINNDPLQFGSHGKPISASHINTTAAARTDPQTLAQQTGAQLNLVALPTRNIENWGESAMADSPRTDTSTDPDTDERNQMFEQGLLAGPTASDSSDKSRDKLDQKTLRRLAQNREAARKSRLRKKGIFISTSVDQSQSMSGNGALAFDMEYARWLEEHNKHINELRAAFNAHAGDNDLRIIVESIMVHYEEIFRLKGVAAKADVFHVLSGMWKTPAERCFMWLGGFRSSELLKLLAGQLEPLTDQQLVGISNLQQSSQQAEDALSQGMEALQQSLAETLASGSLGPAGSSGNVANYMGQMAMAMGKLGTLENFLRQADNLRLQTLQQMQRILTTRQSARALLAISDYFSRLRALSSLWLARPRE
ncbi:transcription factor TGAL1-like isoform X2 [Phragmites australis]|uniref:transcription factor TGAL1-like isoform X2 n=1 Tax=Phragmites australis TaxID=29695 RepID=UPI002D76CBFE|nr:transcription factor TGAL1-like isoform X2 [Phragmites australis]